MTYGLLIFKGAAAGANAIIVLIRTNDVIYK